ncbi:hypothetical protein [Paenibacillus roseipurpureus]|uniref:Uncharacterized protein n=1 Tax=Paenibacillus roseopurpureus TaxID=2918901 RepID=A0AA96LV67_9BACL|nr:hypothetical protein [Paenibacillus sp. MBLB1832]WNR45235.1 hypothetical protein MJB10_03615 [Paenibacillus sp. MBLB1832]
MESINSKKIDKNLLDNQEQLSVIREDIRELILQRDDISNISMTIENEINKLKQMIVARQIITLIPVERCPICLGKIYIDSASSDNCSYCNNEIDTTDFERISQYKRMLEESLYEANRVKEELVQQIKESEGKKKIIEKRIDNLMGKFVKDQKALNTPMESIVNSIKNRVESLTKDEYLLETQLSFLITKEELKLQKKQLEFDIDALKEELGALEKHVIQTDGFKQDKWKSIYSDELNYIFDSKMNVSFDNEFTPVIDQVNIRNISSASLKVAARLSYITSLFHCQNVQNINHLGFILLDSPKDKDLDLDKYERFLELIERSEVGQVILTGSISDIDLYNGENVILLLNDEHKLLKELK